MNIEVEWDKETERARVVLYQESSRTILFCDLIGFGPNSVSLQVAPLRKEAK